MKTNNLKLLFLISFLIPFSFVGLSQKSENLNKTIVLKEYLVEEKLNVEVKEFFIRRIRKTTLVKDIDNHEFVHYFLDRYNSKYKGDIVLALTKQNKTTLSLAEILSVSDSLIGLMANDFNSYKLANPNSSKTCNDGKVEERSFAFIDMAKQKKGSNDKGLNEPCNNADYETGDGTGWDFTEGDVDNNPYGYINVVGSNLASNQFTMMTGAGMDAVTGAFPVVNPDGGTFSLMVGDGTGSNYRAASVSQTFLVDATSEAFTYSYALVLEDPSGHSLGQKPYFKVNMYDQSGASITCGDYEVISGPVSSGGDPDFIAYPGGFYLPWRTTFAPLQGYVGQNVTIEFIIGDCGQGGHYGYGYIDASCQPLEIIPSQTVICGGAPVTLTAPAGAASYLWSPGGQTTQSITTNVPGNYSVDVIPVTGPACALTLTATIGGSPDYPVAEFNANPTSVCAGTPITFNNTSYVVGPSAIDSVEWDFNSDGIIDDTNFNTSHTYPAAGNYAVTLTVYNNGCDDDTTINVTVTPGTTADFTSTTVCQGVATNFTDVSVPGGTVVNWDWDFDNDGVSDNTNQNPTYTFPSAGTFPVELSVSGVGGSCPNDTVINVTVNPNPVASFSADTVCYGTLTTFTDNSNVGTGVITNWDWDFGDAVGTSVAQNPTYTYGTNNTFSTTLIVTTDSGCVDTTEIDVYIHDLPVADFTPDTACAGNVSQFMDVTATASGIQNWSWDFDNDGNEDANTQNPTYTFPGFGTYPVSLSVIDNNGCTHDTIKNVYVSAQPTADFTVTNECFGSANNFTDLSNPNGGVIASWDWDFTNDGTVDDTNQNPSNGYPSSGNYTVELLVTTQLGCVDSITKPVSVHPIPVADFTVDTACYGTLTTFTDNSNVGTGAITNWDWDFGDAVGTSVAQNPTYTYGTNNTFTTTLIVTTDSGCVDTTEIDVYIHDLPVADFTPDTACAGNVSQFMDVTATASGIQNWSWDFDNDGNEDANTQNPTYTFPGFGTYPVSLSVIDNNGCTHDTIKNVYVSAQPTADFTVTNECFGSANNFTDLSNPNGGVIASWDWDFTNDGTVDDTNQNPSNGYPSSGNYTVELLVTTQLGCVDSITKPVSVHPMPVANFSVADVCLNDVSNLYDSSTVATGNIISWAWDFDNDGNIDDTNQNPTNTYATDGTFAVTLTVTTDSGCINIYTDSATVDPLPTAAFTVNNICIDTAAIYTDNSNGNGGTIANWDWDFDGDGTTDNTNQNPTNTYASHGQYNVQLIVSTAAGCADTITQPIDIYPMPVADFTFQNQCYATPVPFTDNSMVATGAITGWQWYFGNTNTSIAQNPSENYGSEGVYEVQLVVTTDNGCRDTVTHNNIEVYPTPVVDFTPTDVCLNAPTVFQDLSNVSNMYTTNNITNWDWDFGDGVGTSNLQNPTYTYTQEGTYAAELIVVSNHGCTDSLTKNVTVHPLPTVDFEGPAQGCSPVCVQLINNSAITSGTIDTWVWNFGDGNTSGSQAPNHCWYNDSQTSAENYDVTLTAISNFGCVDSMTIPAMVTSYPIPQAIFTYNPLETDIYDPEINFIDQSIIASQWQWDLGDGTTSTIQNPVHTYADSGTYVVTLYMENTYGCRDTATKNVVIKPTFAIWIPNVFTPDGDGVNDYWFSDGYGITELQTLVFDRWGLVVYEGYQLDSKWDGTYKGKMSIQDTYVYKIKARDVFGEWHEYIGKVTLLK